MMFAKKLLVLLFVYAIASVTLLFYFGSIADVAIERVLKAIALFESTKSKEAIHAVAIGLQIDFFVPALIVYGVAGVVFLVVSFVFFDLPPANLTGNEFRKGIKG